MRSAILKATLLLAALMLFSSSPVTAQEFSISKNRGDLNTDPRTALNTRNNTEVFVVWRGAVEGDFAHFEIYSALVKQRNNGRFKARKVRQVGNAGQRVFRYDVAYHEASNRYLVVFNGGNANEVVGSLWGQWFRSNGRPQGDAFRIFQDTELGVTVPGIAALPFDENSLLADEHSFLLFFNGRSLVGNHDSDSGFYTARLDGDGLLASTPRRVLNSSGDGEVSTYEFIDVEHTPRNTYLISLVHSVPPEAIDDDQPMLVTVDPLGNLLRSNTYDDDAVYLDALVLDNKRCVTFWRNSQTYTHAIVKYRRLNNGRRADVSADVLFAQASTMSRRDDTDGGFQFLFSSTGFSVHQLDRRGRFQSETFDEVEFGFSLDWKVASTLIPGQKQILLFAARENDTDDVELVGYQWQWVSIF